MTNKSNKINELFENKEFAEAFATLDTDEAVIALFADNGVEMTEDELHAIVEYATATESDSKELNADDLDNVSGGVVGYFVIGCLAVGFFAGYGKRSLSRR